MKKTHELTQMIESELENPRNMLPNQWCAYKKVKFQRWAFSNESKRWHLIHNMNSDEFEFEHLTRPEREDIKTLMKEIDDIIYPEPSAFGGTESTYDISIRVCHNIKSHSKDLSTPNTYEGQYNTTTTMLTIPCEYTIMALRFYLSSYFTTKRTIWDQKDDICAYYILPSENIKMKKSDWIIQQPFSDMKNSFILQPEMNSKNVISLIRKHNIFVFEIKVLV